MPYRSKTPNANSNYFFEVETKHAYLVIGAENAGNRMLVEALISSGCYGTASTEQAMDDHCFTDLPHYIAYFQSVPHGDNLPDLRGIARKLRKAGYRVHPILMYRKTDFMLPGQREAGHGMRHDEVQEHVQLAAEMAYDVACCLKEKLAVVIYELFVMLPQIRRRVFHQLGLPEPQMEFFNANEQYQLEGPPFPW